MERAVIALCRSLLILALGLFALGYVCRDRVGAAMFSRALGQRRGLSCSQPEVNVAASLNYVRLSPLHCQVSEGPVRAFETGVTHLRLLRLHVRSAELESATVDYHERDVSHVKAIQPDEIGRSSAEQQLRRKLLGAMLDASEMYSVDAPSISVKTLTVTRAGHLQLVMHAFRKSLDGTWNRSQAEWVECPADASLELRSLDMRVVPGWGKLSAIVAQGPRTHPQAMALRLEGRRLDGLKPRVVTELGPVAQPTNRLL